MTKRYILSREDLENLIHESITFFSDKTRTCMEKNLRVMFSDRTKWISEFLNLSLKEIPVDELLDKVDETLSSYTGSSIDEIKNRLKKKQPNYEKQIEGVKDFIKLIEENLQQ